MKNLKLVLLMALIVTPAIAMSHPVQAEGGHFRPIQVHDRSSKLHDHSSAAHH